MSIITEKLKGGAGLPPSYLCLPSYLGDFHKTMVAEMSAATRKELVAGPMGLSVLSFKDAVIDMDELCFGLGGEGQACQAVIKFTYKTARQTAGAKLGTQNSQEMPPSLFDLLVVTPLAVAGLSQLGVCGAMHDGSIIGKCFSPQEGFAGVKFDETDGWLKLLMPINVKPSDDNKAAKTKDGYDMTVYLAPALAERLAGLAAVQDMPSARDPNDPWLMHMREIVMESERALNVVIEDLNLSVAACTRLELGQIITLPGASHERLKVTTALGASHVVLARASLGIYKANKAIKLNDAVNPSFLSDFRIIDHESVPPKP